MSNGMNVKEAEKIADKMSYREAIMNCLHAKCVPYRKATKIKMKRLLESIDNDFTDDLLNQGYTKGLQQGKTDAINIDLDTPMHFTPEQKAWIKNYIIKNGKANYERGAREFAKWLTNYAFDHIDYVCNGHFINRQGRQTSVDEVLAEWQKGVENE